MKIYIVRINKKIFKAFVRKEDAEKYYEILNEVAYSKLVQHLASYNTDVDIICIPVDEDELSFDMALYKTAHAGAGSCVVTFEYEPFPILKKA